MKVEIKVIESFEYADGVGQKKKYLAGTDYFINKRAAQGIVDKGWARLKESAAEQAMEAVGPESEPPKRHRK